MRESMFEDGNCGDVLLSDIPQIRKDFERVGTIDVLSWRGLQIMRKHANRTEAVVLGRCGEYFRCSFLPEPAAGWNTTRPVLNTSRNFVCEADGDGRQRQPERFRQCVRHLADVELRRTRVHLISLSICDIVRLHCHAIVAVDSLRRLTWINICCSSNSKSWERSSLQDVINGRLYGTPE